MMSLFDKIKKKKKIASCYNLFSKQVSKLLQEGEYVKALNLSLDGVELFPNYIPGRLTLSNCYVWIKDWNNAIDNFNKTLKIDNQCIGALRGLLKIYKSQNNEKDLLKISSAIYQLDPYDKQVEKDINLLSNKVKDRNEKTSKLVAYQKDEDLSNVATPTLAKIYLKQGLKKEAYKIYEELYKKNPQKKEFYEKMQEISLSFN